MVNGEQIISNRQLCRIGTEGEDTLGDLPNRIRPYLVRGWELTGLRSSSNFIKNSAGKDANEQGAFGGVIMGGGRWTSFVSGLDQSPGHSPLTMNNATGQNVYIDLGNGTPIIPQGEFTIMTLVNPHSIRNWARIIDIGDGAAKKNLMLGRFGATNHLVFEM
jgi:hypothetical protein